MRIVVTGASGNVGSAVLRALSRPGGPLAVDEIRAIARRVPPRATEGRTRWFRCDLGEPDAEATLAPIMAGADAVVHLAWLIQPSHDRRLMLRTNVLGTRAVIAAAEAAGVRHLVHTSSVGAYSVGPKDRLVGEEWPVGGILSSRYSRDKVAAEHLLDAAETRERIPVLSRLRPALIVQRRAASELLRYFLPAPARPLARRPVPVLPLPDRAITQFVHADDVAQALVLILLAGVGGGRIAGHPAGAGAFNLAPVAALHPDEIAAAFGARRLSVPESALRAGAALTWAAHLQPVDPGWLDMLVGHPLLDSSRARDELGWEPRYTGAAALAEVVEGIRAGAGDRGPVLRPLRTVS